MIEAYLDFVKNYPLLSSAMQIGVLGTMGELLAVRIRMKRWYFFGPRPMKLLLKAVIWAFLGITFKYAFTGFFAYMDAIILKGWWFNLEKGSFLYALSVSFFANIIYGPVFVTFHRFTDNKIEGKEMDWESLQKAWWSLVWFWIPAMTTVFILPPHLRIGLLSLWNIVLGAMLGYFAVKSQKN
ncbi:hypothetical protein [Reichenbachiella sp.]|uniref:hypothetical protein n=1 Tax=Reichenbachiella sp. TaxID=2184521 RepID=UPI003BB048A9